jgi:hypothetical protein
MNLVDALIGVVIVISVLGVIAVQSKWMRTSGQMILGETELDYTVLIRNLKTLKRDLFVPGKNLSITIRNQPRGEVTIMAVEATPKKIVLPDNKGGAVVLDDPADEYGFDYKVHLRDHALIGKDGYVTEGIKVKIGLPIEVEGFDYRVNGVIVSVDKAPPAKLPASQS